MCYSKFTLEQLTDVKLGILYSRVYVESAKFNYQELTQKELDIINIKHHDFIKERFLE